MCTYLITQYWFTVYRLKQEGQITAVTESTDVYIDTVATIAETCISAVAASTEIGISTKESELLTLEEVVRAEREDCSKVQR